MCTTHTQTPVQSAPRFLPPSLPLSDFRAFSFDVVCSPPLMNLLRASTDSSEAKINPRIARVPDRVPETEAMGKVMGWEEEGCIRRCELIPEGKVFSSGCLQTIPHQLIRRICK